MFVFSWLCHCSSFSVAFFFSFRKQNALAQWLPHVIPLGVLSFGILFLFSLWKLRAQKHICFCKIISLVDFGRIMRLILAYWLYYAEIKTPPDFWKFLRLILFCFTLVSNWRILLNTIFEQKKFLETKKLFHSENYFISNPPTWNKQIPLYLEKCTKYPNAASKMF